MARSAFVSAIYFNQKNQSLRGFGEDNSGRFILHGLYCKSAQIIKMTWSYEVSNFLEANETYKL